MVVDGIERVGMFGCGGNVGERRCLGIPNNGGDDNNNNLGVGCWQVLTRKTQVSSDSSPENSTAPSSFFPIGGGVFRCSNLKCHRGRVQHADLILSQDCLAQHFHPSSHSQSAPLTLSSVSPPHSLLPSLSPPLRTEAAFSSGRPCLDWA